MPQSSWRGGLLLLRWRQHQYQPAWHVQCRLCCKDEGTSKAIDQEHQQQESTKSSGRWQQHIVEREGNQEEWRGGVSSSIAHAGNSRKAITRGGSAVPAEDCPPAFDESRRWYCLGKIVDDKTVKMHSRKHPICNVLLLFSRHYMYSCRDMDSSQFNFTLSII